MSSERESKQKITMFFSKKTNAQESLEELYQSILKRSLNGENFHSSSSFEHRSLEQQFVELYENLHTKKEFAKNLKAHFNVKERFDDVGVAVSILRYIAKDFEKSTAPTKRIEDQNHKCLVM